MSQPHDLASYQDYLALIHVYARSKGIKIARNETIDGGLWYPDARTIYLEDDMEESEAIAVLLHELGHETDPALMTQPVRRAYFAFHKHKATPRQRKRVLYSEVRAWMVGRVIAKYLGIPLNKWYTDMERSNLDQYWDAVQR